MTDTTEFIEDFLQHEYDPVKAHEYYMRTRKLKGRASATEKAGAKAYEQHQTADAQKKLNADIKGKPVVLSKTRRIGAAEQKLIRARSLAMRVKDPQVKADMLARVRTAEAKLRKVKGTIDLIDPKKATAAKDATKDHPKSKVQYNGKPLRKLGTRMEEDETPEVSPGGAKLKDYDGKGLGKATYSDGSVYDAKTGWRKPAAPKKKSRIHL